MQNYKLFIIHYFCDFVDKIQARKQMEAEKGITRTMNPIDDFCERFDRAVQRNVPEVSV